ncbi:MAG TPA: aromatic ring-hydroxylating dioxygenase subunit alpha [Steroidobacteraceae bacterium]|nr:aromatic ring-hydroxylating dioxygenase subunit alpha [Steroidobacteraceae bacterium]
MAADDLIALLERFYTPEHPELGTGPVPTAPYISKEYFELEKQRIFSDTWLLACHESEIPEPGDFLIKEIALFRASVIIVRGTDGRVRAVHNVCRHRGNKVLCEEGYGSTKAFFCRFHGWTYGLDGRLRGIPESDRFPGIEKSEHGLKPYTMDLWNGFVFINAAANPAKGLRAYLGSLAATLDPYPFSAMVPLSHHSATLRTNWKVGVNAFQEAYHVPTVHAVGAPKIFSSRLVAFRFHGPHRSMTLPIAPNFSMFPVHVLSSKLTSGMSQNAIDPEKAGHFPGTNPCNVPNFSFDINVVFPSSYIDVGDGYYFTYEFWPISVNETHFIFKSYALPARSWGQRIGQELSIIFLREGVAEDLSTLESTQEGLESDVMQTMVLSDQEIAIRHQHAVIEHALGK